MPRSRFKSLGVRGFTLIEVLVALGIVAVALAAGVRATGSLTAPCCSMSPASTPSSSDFAALE